MRRRTTGVVLLAATALAGCGSQGPALGTASPQNAASTSPAPSMPAGVEGPLAVTKVVDGDTIWVRRGGDRVKLRLIGIDSPETVDPGEPVQCYGPESSQRARDLLAHAQVYLERDPSQDTTDRYGRELVYVWTADGTLVNLAMIQGGFARELTYDGTYAYRDQFTAAEAQARAAGAGMWGIEGCAS